MYLFVDRPVTLLTGQARLLLGAIRAWNAAFVNHRCPAAAISKHLIAHHEPTVAPLNMVMAIMTLDVYRPLEVSAPHASNIGDGEAVWLALWCHFARDDRKYARATLALLLPGHLVETAMRAFDDALCVFAQSGVRFTTILDHPNRKALK